MRLEMVAKAGTETGVSTAGAAIRVVGVRKSFGSVHALKGVDLAVERGTVFALLGPNGAGKTTLVKVLTTLLRPDEGRAEVAGLDVVRDAAALRARIGLAGQYAAVDGILTGRENVELVARLYHLPRADAKRRATELLEQFDLVEAADRQVKTYSGGMRRRLDLAASLVVRPEVLFLDEPTTGLDPRSRLDLWRVLESLVAEGITLLLTTQYLEEADRLAHRIAVIDQGGIIAEGTADELKSQVGGDVLELRTKVPSDAARAVEVLSHVHAGGANVEPTTGRVSIPVADGALDLAQVVRDLDAAGVAIVELSLRRPTLDDVFLKLTGRAAEAAAEVVAEERSPGRWRSRGGA